MKIDDIRKFKEELKNEIIRECGVPSSLYGSYLITDVELERRLRAFFYKQSTIFNSKLYELEKRLGALEGVIRPDETDVHNINRRLEILAQRLSFLESKRNYWRISLPAVIIFVVIFLVIPVSLAALWMAELL